MTPDERKLILTLVANPGSSRQGSPAVVLRHFGATDGRALARDLLVDALRRQDAVDVEMALIVCDTFGFTMDLVEPLITLSFADWHQRHEEVVSALGELHTPRAVEALRQATQWVPRYLEYDEGRSLASKAVWALGRIPGPEAERALIELLDSDSAIVRDGARDQLARR